MKIRRLKSHIVSDLQIPKSELSVCLKVGEEIVSEIPIDIRPGQIQVGDELEINMTYRFEEGDSET